MALSANQSIKIILPVLACSIQFVPHTRRMYPNAIKENPLLSASKQTSKKPPTFAKSLGTWLIKAFQNSLAVPNLLLVTVC